jgi:hypothetical protein
VGIEPKISTGYQGNEPARLLADVDTRKTQYEKKYLSPRDLNKRRKRKDLVGQRRI